MPRYEIRNTSTDELSYVEGDVPLNLSGLVPVGTYRARVMSAEEPTDIVIAAVNPDFTNLAYASPGGGEPNVLTLTYTYTGAPETLVAYGVTSTEAVPPGADAAAIRANIIAGTGTGALEEFSVDPFSGSTLELLAGALTATSGTATHAHIFIGEKNNGGVSEVRTVALSSLDFVVPTLSSAEAINATTVILTFSETLFGTVSAGQFAFDIDGAAATITNASLSGDTVTLTVSDTILAADVLDALAYTPGDLRDVRGNAVAAFSAQAITNGLTSAITRLAATSALTVTTSPISTVQTSSTITAQAGSNRVAILFVACRANGGSPITGLTAAWGAQAFTELWRSRSPTIFGNDPLVFAFYIKEADIPAGANAISVTPVGGSVDGLSVDLVEYENVAQVTTFGTSVRSMPAGSANSADVTVNMTSASSMMLSNVIIIRDTGAPYTVSAGTKVVDKNVSLRFSTCAIEQLVGATGNNTHTYTTGDLQTGSSGIAAVEMFTA